MTDVDTSPHIETFKKETAEDPVAAAAKLRGELQAAAGPLVEYVDGDDSRVRYTFVWIGSQKPVTVHCQLFGVDQVVHPMSQVPGTDVWHLSAIGRSDLTTTYQFVIDDPMLTVDDPLELFQDPERLVVHRRKTIERSRVDPHNQQRIFPVSAMLALEEPDLPPSQWESVLNGPKAQPLSEYFEPADVGSRGSLDTHRLSSAALGNERTLTIYTPHGYSTGASPYPLLVLLDGEKQLHCLNFANALDQLIARGEIPPLVAVFVHNASNLSRMFELTCNPSFTTLIVDEVLPYTRARYHVTENPAHVILGGGSYGGLGSSFVAFERPDAIGNVLSNSGSYWWGHRNETGYFAFGRDGEPEWLTRQYASAARKPLRFWIDVGDLEVGMMEIAPGVDQRAANRHFRTVLQAKGYELAGYYEAPGGHEGASMRRAAVIGLRTLLAPRELS